MTHCRDRQAIYNWLEYKLYSIIVSAELIACSVFYTLRTSINLHSTGVIIPKLSQLASSNYHLEIISIIILKDLSCHPEFFSIVILN